MKSDFIALEKAAQMFRRRTKSWQSPVKVTMLLVCTCWSEFLLKELGRHWWRLMLGLVMDQDKVIIDGKHPIDPLSTIYIVD
jgi:hypothetical protein